MNATRTSRQRVIDHGEVFTPPGLVNNMLDLVAHECDRVDSRFLEPACGDGNFLAEILRRRLVVVDQKHRRSMLQWEQNALLGLACLYGIELLHDNVAACRARLLSIFQDAYQGRFKSRAQPACIGAAQIIVRNNILLGDALAMSTVEHDARALLFTEWSLLPGGLFKRRHFEYHQLVRTAEGPTAGLFGGGVDAHQGDHGQAVFIAQPIRDLPLIHYRQLAREGH